MIISIQSQKGGVGKTTLCINISYTLAKKRSQNRILLIDSDPQGSALDWATAREGEVPFMVIGLDRPTIHRDLPQMAADYDYVIIDGPPRVSDLARSGIIASDLVVIPVQPSPYDVWAAASTVELIKEASVFKENLKSLFVINRKIVNTAIGRDVVSALGEYPIPVAKTQICQRVIFAESAVNGKAVMEVSRNHTAVKEIKTLVKELLTYAQEN